MFGWSGHTSIQWVGSICAAASTRKRTGFNTTRAETEKSRRRYCSCCVSDMSRPVQHAPESRVRPALAHSHIPGLGLGISVPKETQTLKRVSERSAADVQHGSTPFERAPTRTNDSSRLAPALADARAHAHAHAPTMPSLATSDRIAINDVLEQYKPCLLYTSPSPRD